MRVLVLGGSGMLGHKLVQVLGEAAEVVATVRASRAPAPLDAERTLTGVSAEDFDTVVRAVAASRPDVVVNAIGIVKQAAAAKDPLPSLTVNALFPHRLAALCAASGSRLVHVSTDCVFSGTTGGYTEADPPDPPDLYGRSKLLGEVAGPGALTLRTSIVGRELAGASGLVEWFLAQRDRARGFTRAVFSGLTTLALSEVVAAIVTDHPDLDGLWHVAAAPIDKHTLLTLVRDAYGLPIELEPVAEPAIDRSLDATRFRTATGLEAPSWPDMIERMVADPTPYEALRGSAHAHR